MGGLIRAKNRVTWRKETPKQGKGKEKRRVNSALRGETEEGQTTMGTG